MSKIEDILKEAKEKGASDVHITVGLPPKMRLNGKLIAMESYDKMMPADTQQIADEVMNDKQKEKLEEKCQNDIPRTTLSCGIAISKSGWNESLIEKADAALYEIKRAGRNGYKFAE